MRYFPTWWLTFLCQHAREAKWMLIATFWASGLTFYQTARIPCTGSVFNDMLFNFANNFFPQNVHLIDLESMQRSEGQRVQIWVYPPPVTSVSFFSTDEERIGLEAAPVVRPGPLPEVGRDRSGDSRHSDVAEPKRQDRFRLRPPLVEGPEREI